MDQRAAVSLAGVLSLAAVAFTASPAAAQHTTQGGAFVQVPAVSQLEVEAVEPTAGESGAESGVYRIRVRANHAWRILVTAAAGAEGSIRVRTGSGSTAYRLEPGREAVIASGERGATVVEVEYQWQPSQARVGSAPPLIYTLFST